MRRRTARGQGQPRSHTALASRLRCADLRPGGREADRQGNPEQDCFTRFVHIAPPGLKLVYMFDELNKSLRHLPLNQTTMARLGEAPHPEFSCVADLFVECRPWFLHFQVLAPPLFLGGRVDRERLE